MTLSAQGRFEWTGERWAEPHGYEVLAVCQVSLAKLEFNFPESPSLCCCAVRNLLAQLLDTGQQLVWNYSSY